MNKNNIKLCRSHHINVLPIGNEHQGNTEDMLINKIV